MRLSPTEVLDVVCDWLARSPDPAIPIALTACALMPPEVDRETVYEAVLIAAREAIKNAPCHPEIVATAVWRALPLEIRTGALRPDRLA